MNFFRFIDLNCTSLIGVFILIKNHQKSNGSDNLGKIINIIKLLGKSCESSCHVQKIVEILQFIHLWFLFKEMELFGHTIFKKKNCMCNLYENKIYDSMFTSETPALLWIFESSKVDIQQEVDIDIFLKLIKPYGMLKQRMC